ncbi:Redox-sensitive transcriptional activator SoxR [plant metagenome]|uniref:Redox-sensitive transcriptional activator SoxR n=1 Tax=plant metagenome TaxID=1297885 RepID=A0A484YRX6_9ZZZZ
MLTVGDVASRSGVAVSAIRFYEAQGLIQSTRTAGNQRRYPRSVLRRVSVIRIAQRAGLSLSEIKAHMDKLSQDNVTVGQWRQLSRGWQELIDQRIVSLTQLRDRLGDCIGCGCLSLKNCPLRNPGDVLGQRGAGPRLLLED